MSSENLDVKNLIGKIPLHNFTVRPRKKSVADASEISLVSAPATEMSVPMTYSHLSDSEDEDTKS